MDYRELPLKWLEGVLAVLTLLPLFMLIYDVSISLPSEVNTLAWIVLSTFVSGSLALVVLLSTLAHGYRLYTRYRGTTAQNRSGDTAVSRILFSTGLGLLAAYTLLWVIGLLSVMILPTDGGVLPTIWVVFFGGVLAVLVLFKLLFFRLFPQGPVASIRRLRTGGN